MRRIRSLLENINSPQWRNVSNESLVLFSSFVASLFYRPTDTKRSFSDFEPSALCYSDYGSKVFKFHDTDPLCLLGYFHPVVTFTGTYECRIKRSRFHPLRLHLWVSRLWIYSFPHETPGLHFAILHVRSLPVGAPSTEVLITENLDCYFEIYIHDGNQTFALDSDRTF